MSQMCPRCYRVVDRACQSPPEVEACSYMKRVLMHGLAKGGTDEWDVDTKHGMARAVEWMERQLAILSDQARWVIPRSGSIVVIDKKNKRAIRVLGMAPETSTKAVFEAMGWKWIDAANGERVDD